MIPGLSNAPISKFVLNCCNISSLLNIYFSFQESAHKNALSKYCFMSQFPYHSIFMFAACFYLIPVFRAVESHFGTRKFGSFVFLSFSLSLAVKFMFGQYIAFATGPYWWIFSILAVYISHFPHGGPIFGTVSLKGSFILASSFIALVGGKHSISSSLMGLIIGFMVNNFSLLSKFRLPHFITNVFQREPVLARKVDVIRRIPRAPAPPPTTQSDLSESDIKSLMDMGFEREKVIRALIASNNSVSAACNLLLDDVSSE